MQLDRARDLRVHVLGFRVVAAHEPLQLGELADHARHEIGLGELGRALRQRRLAQLLRLRNLAGKLLDALGALELRAELLVEGDALQLVAHDLELLLQVLLPEELGVREPRGDYLLVAGDDLLAAVLGLEVGDEQEMVCELLAVPEREALLVHLHGGRQAFRRHLEESLVELAHEHDRPLGEAGVLGEQRVVLDEGELGILGESVRSLRDQRGTRVAVEDHLVALQGLRIVGKA